MPRNESSDLFHRPLSESDLSSLTERTFLRAVKHFTETDSTNAQAIKLLGADPDGESASRLETPCLVYAESQTAGRGRGVNRWWSQTGSLTFSVIIDTQSFSLTPQQQIKLPLVTGLAVLRSAHHALNERKDCEHEFALKWPNDVYLSGRKLAGILIEVPGSSSMNAVIGVGLNVNNTWSDAPEELQHKGISLRDQAGVTFDRLEILVQFLSHLEQLIHSLAEGEPVLDGWSEHCLLTNKRVTIQVGDEEISGDCLGLAANGALMLKTDQGTRQFMGGIVKSWSD